MRPYYRDDHVTLYLGDCREVLPSIGEHACAIADPPYQETALEWDRWDGAFLRLLPTKSLWCFGSLRMFTQRAKDFRGWRLAQDLIWQKHNGSSFHADRFRRVHETIAHFYRGPWSQVFRAPVYTMDATKRTTRRKKRPPHMGNIGASAYTSTDGGPRLQVSVLKARSEHGRALHPTQKPIAVLLPLIRYSCPPGGGVLVPFAGVGSEMVAAKQLGLRATGIEIREEFCEKAAERLAQTHLELGGVA